MMVITQVENPVSVKAKKLKAAKEPEVPRGLSRNCRFDT